LPVRGLTVSLIALTRPVPASMARCELTHVARQPIDLARAADQHRRYEEALRQAGCRVERLPAAPDLADSVFVEDAAVVVGELAVIARPGAVSRRPETEAVARALARYRPIAPIEAPGTLDGGDVLIAGRTVYVGVGGRTNGAGLEQLERHLAPHGYRARAVETRGCLHLKSAATIAAEDCVLVNPGWVDPAVFSALERIHIDPAEPFAANVLRVGTTLIVSAAAPRTAARLAARGLDLLPIDMSELAKAEGALTCCSVILRSASRPAASTMNTKARSG
jgi:dimethylargininase